MPAMDNAPGEPVIALLLIAVCVGLAASGPLPAWTMTLLLWITAPLLLWRFGEEYAPWNVVYGSLHPVLIVFLAGFTFAAAAERHGIDEKMARAAINFARGDPLRLVALLAATTIWLSAWISNVAAAALMFGAVRPMLQDSVPPAQRRSLLMVIAIAANLGGMATPIGTGANAVALAAVSPVHSVAFIKWMLFAVPLTVVLTTLLVALALHLAGPAARQRIAPLRPFKDPPFEIRTASIFTTTVILWVTEPMHNVEMHVVALTAVLMLFVTGAVTARDLRKVDWGSLLLIAGGIGIGNIMSRSGGASMLMHVIPISTAHPTVVLLVLCLLSSSLAAVMSNTGTAALLIPMAMALLTQPSTAILIALATALGFPFVVSTPANVMAVQRGVPASGLLRVSLPAMVLGSALLALTGRYVLGILGIP
jgi:sodium-dependent dicarboxylate transporter 2/3/5